MDEVTGTAYTIELPGGGTFPGQTPEEVDLAEKVKRSYVNEFNITKGSDLQHVADIVVQRILIQRAHQEMSGLEPAFDARGRPTGELVRSNSKPSAREIAQLQKTVAEAQREIRAIDKALGVDKVTREQGSGETVQDYLKRVKGAGHEYGVHLHGSVKEIVKVFKDCSWRLRLLHEGDEEDRAHHGLSEEQFCDWMRDQILRVEEAEKRWAKDRYALYVGKL